MVVTALFLSSSAARASSWKPVILLTCSGGAGGWDLPEYARSSGAATCSGWKPSGRGSLGIHSAAEPGSLNLRSESRSANHTRALSLSARILRALNPAGMAPISFRSGIDDELEERDLWLDEFEYNIYDSSDEDDDNQHDGGIPDPIEEVEPEADEEEEPGNEESDQEENHDSEEEEEESEEESDQEEETSGDEGDDEDEDEDDNDDDNNDNDVDNDENDDDEEQPEDGPEADNGGVEGDDEDEDQGDQPAGEEDQVKEQEEKKEGEKYPKEKKEDESNVNEASVESKGEEGSDSVSAEAGGQQEYSPLAQSGCPPEGDQHPPEGDNPALVHRPSFTPTQLEELEYTFHTTPYPCSTMRHDLARRMQVTEGRIRIWFKNRRSKWRRLQRGIPSESSSPDDLDPSVTINSGENCNVSHLQQPSHTWMVADQVPMAQVPMPSPMMPYVPMYSPPYPPPYSVLPAVAAAPPVHPEPYPPAMAPGMQAQFTMHPMPVYPQPLPPCCQSCNGATWYLTISGPYYNRLY